MKTFFEYCSAYLKRMSLVDFVLLKICIFSFAALIGMTLSPKHREVKLSILTVIFSVSSLMLMKGFFRFFNAHRLHAME